jgi:hypothetical protein
MEKYGFILAKASKSSLHHVARAGETRFCMPDGAATLLPLPLQPPVKQIELLAAVVNFAVLVSRRLPAPENRRTRASPVPHTGHVLCTLDGCVSIVSYPKQQHFSIELIDSTHWAAQTVRDIQGMGHHDFRSFWTARGECVGTVATHDAWHSPERIRYHTHAAARGFSWVEWVIVVASHAGHDQSTLGPQSGLQSLDQTSRSTLDRCHLRACGVNHQNLCELHFQSKEVPDQFIIVDCPKRHGFLMRPPNGARVSGVGGTTPTTDQSAEPHTAAVPPSAAAVRERGSLIGLRMPWRNRP